MTKKKSVGRPIVADKKIRVSFTERESVYNKAIKYWGRKGVNAYLQRSLCVLAEGKKILKEIV